MYSRDDFELFKLVRDEGMSVADAAAAVEATRRTGFNWLTGLQTRCLTPLLLRGQTEGVPGGERSRTGTGGPSAAPSRRPEKSFAFPFRKHSQFVLISELHRLFLSLPILRSRLAK